MVVALFYALNSNGTMIGARSLASALSYGLCFFAVGGWGGGTRPTREVVKCSVEINHF